MDKYLIEVPHEETKEACVNAIKIFMQTGSHFLSNADWGCYDGEHKAWLLVEVDSKEQAQQIIPPAYRSRAKIVKLHNFSKAEMDHMDEVHHS